MADETPEEFHDRQKEILVNEEFQPMEPEQVIDGSVVETRQRLVKNLVAGKHLANRDDRVVRGRQERMLELQLRHVAWDGYDAGFTYGCITKENGLFRMMEEFPLAPAREFAAWRKVDGPCPICGVKLKQVNTMMGQCRDCGWPDQETLNKWKGEPEWEPAQKNLKVGKKLL